MRSGRGGRTGGAAPRRVRARWRVPVRLLARLAVIGGLGAIAWLIGGATQAGAAPVTGGMTAHPSSPNVSEPLASASDPTSPARTMTRSVSAGSRPVPVLNDLLGGVAGTVTSAASAPGGPVTRVTGAAGGVTRGLGATVPGTARAGPGALTGTLVRAVAGTAGPTVTGPRALVPTVLGTVLAVPGTLVDTTTSVIGPVAGTLVNGVLKPVTTALGDTVTGVGKALPGTLRPIVGGLGTVVARSPDRLPTGGDLTRSAPLPLPAVPPVTGPGAAVVPPGVQAAPEVPTGPVGRTGPVVVPRPRSGVPAAVPGAVHPRVAVSVAQMTAGGRAGPSGSPSRGPIRPVPFRSSPGPGDAPTSQRTGGGQSHGGAGDLAHASLRAPMLYRLALADSSGNASAAPDEPAVSPD